jgi:hypothetical protein
MNQRFIFIIKDDMAAAAAFHSKGRVAPVGPQAIVVATYAAARHKRRERSAKIGYSPYEKTVSVDGYSLRKGELAFVDVADIKKRKSGASLNFSNIPVWTSWNQRQADESNPRFVGVVDKEWSADKPNSDDAVTIRMSGTASVVNSGDKTIYHGDSVWWSKPLTTTDGHPTCTVAGLPKEKYTAGLTNVCPTALTVAELMGGTYDLGNSLLLPTLKKFLRSRDENADLLLMNNLITAFRRFAQEDAGRVMVEFLLYMMSHQQKRVGVALNNAPKGGQLDLLLGY